MESARSLPVADGVTLHYRLWRQDTGAAHRPLVVLLHGMASNFTRWSEFIEHTTLKERFDILRLDLRGHGESFTRQPIGMEIWADDLARILEAESYARAIVVGHSLGANVALWFALRHPTRAAGLALIDPTFTEALRGSALWLHRLAPLLRAGVALLRLLNRLGLRRKVIPKRDLRTLDEDVRVQLLGAGREEDFVKRYTSPLADIKYFSTAHYLKEFLEITRPIPRLQQIDAPVLALVSRAVTFTDIDTTRAVLTRCPNSQIALLTAYHWPLTERPVEVRRAIEDWCGNFERRDG
jgi:pimeloyl-ACP methyl ester carboxylesterase